MIHFLHKIFDVLSPCSSLLDKPLPMVSPIYSQIGRLLIAAAALSSGTIVSAATIYWDGSDTTADADGGSGTWGTSGSNWDSAASGGGNVNFSTWDTVIFGGTGGTVTTSGSLNVNTLTFNADGFIINGSGVTNDLTLGEPLADNFTVATGVTARINANIRNYPDPDQSWSYTGFRKAGAGTLQLGGTNSFEDFTVKNGTAEIVAGTTSVTSSLSVSNNNYQVNEGVTSTLKVSGGTLNVSGDNFYTGRSTNGSNLASRIIITGGALNYTNGSGWFGLADGGGATQVDISGGSLTTAVGILAGTRNYVNFNLTGGTVTAPYYAFYYSDGVTGSGKTSTLTLGGTGAFVVGAGGVYNNSTANTANVVFDGGTLRASASTSLASTLTNVSISAGGAIFDSNGSRPWVASVA
jgi:hypothetical protein